MSLTHLIPAISAASRNAYLSTLVAYVGTEITISFDIIPAFSKYVFAFLRKYAMTCSGVKVKVSPRQFTSKPIFLFSRSTTL